MAFVFDFLILQRSIVKDEQRAPHLLMSKEGHP